MHAGWGNFFFASENPDVAKKSGGAGALNIIIPFVDACIGCSRFSKPPSHNKSDMAALPTRGGTILFIKPVFSRAAGATRKSGRSPPSPPPGVPVSLPRDRLFFSRSNEITRLFADPRPSRPDVATARRIAHGGRKSGSRMRHHGANGVQLRRRELPAEAKKQDRSPTEIAGAEFRRALQSRIS